MNEVNPGPMPFSKTGKSLDEIVSTGCKFVVDGEVFKVTIDLIEKLIMEGSGDKQAEVFLIQLRGALLESSIPVRAKIGDENKVIVPT